MIEIFQQRLSCRDYEVIVVDNNSTDETADVCKSFADCYGNLQYCFEPKQGLSHARNLGWRSSAGRFVVYIDDDCQVTDSWLSIAKTTIERVDPDVFGGPYFASYDSPKPKWFKDEYGSHDPYRTSCFIEGAPDSLHGGNLFVLKDLLVGVGGFNPNFGMNGECLAYGEETAILRKIQSERPETKFYFAKDLWVKHLVRKEKMQIGWSICQRFTNARFAYRVQPENRPKSGRFCTLRRILKAALRTVSSLTIEPVVRNRKQYPRYQNFVFEQTSQHLTRLGWYIEHQANLKNQALH